MLMRLTGRKPRFGSGVHCVEIKGHKKSGGYYYLTSPDLPGFRATLSPEQMSDITVMAEIIKPALQAYLSVYLRSQSAEDHIKARIYTATVPGHGRHANLVAELAAA